MDDIFKLGFFELTPKPRKTSRYLDSIMMFAVRPSAKKIKKMRKKHKKYRKQLTLPQ